MLIDITKSIDTEELKEVLFNLSTTEYQESILQETIKCIDYFVNEIEQLNKEKEQLQCTIERIRKYNINLRKQYEIYKNAFKKANKAKNTVSKNLNEHIKYLQNIIKKNKSNCDGYSFYSPGYSRCNAYYCKNNCFFSTIERMQEEKPCFAKHSPVNVKCNNCSRFEMCKTFTMLKESQHNKIKRKVCFGMYSNISDVCAECGYKIQCKNIGNCKNK